jgi:hypothetical protein
VWSWTLGEGGVKPSVFFTKTPPPVVVVFSLHYPPSHNSAGPVLLRTHGRTNRKFFGDRPGSGRVGDRRVPSGPTPRPFKPPLRPPAPHLLTFAPWGREEGGGGGVGPWVFRWFFDSLGVNPLLSLAF